MAAMKIDKLTLRLTGVSPSDAERLARRIADGLAQASPVAQGNIASLRLHLKSGDSEDELSSYVARSILERLAQK